MIQHHLIYHFTSLEDNNTYYEANPHSAYYLVRSGKILNLVEDRLGEYAARVMEAILFLGHASVSHLETLPELRYLKAPVANGIANGADPQDNEMEVECQPVETNGDHALEEKPAPLHSTLKALASHGYVMRVRDAHFQSPSDNYLEANRIVSARSDIKALKGKRQQEAIQLKTQELVRERTHSDLAQGLMTDGLPRGIKRKIGRSAVNSSNGQHLENGVNDDHAKKEEEENDWSEDEDGFDNIPMEVRGFHYRS